MTMETINAKKDVLNNIILRAEEIQRKCEDIIVPAAAIKMTDEEKVLIDGQPFEISDWALNQFGNKFGNCGGYLLQCREENASALTAYNANYWLNRRVEAEREMAEKGRKVPRTMIRGYGDRIRAVVSDRYAVCDAPTVLNSLVDFLPEKQWNILGSYLTEERMHLRFVSNEKMKVANDTVFPAVFVDSSDVGRCALDVQFGFYRLVCTNGLVVPAIHMKYHQRHIGISIPKFVAKLEESIALMPAMIEDAEDMIQIASEKVINLNDEEEVEAIVKELRARGKLSKADAENVVKYSAIRYPHTRWGLVNGMTEYAQQKTLEERILMEQAAGFMLAA